MGAAVTAELIGAGHAVSALARSPEAAAKVVGLRASAQLGEVTDLGSLARGAEAADAVIHCGFNHDFTTFLMNCANEDRAVAAIGAALNGTAKKLIVTTGQMAAEESQPPMMHHPQIVSENAAQDLRDSGVNAVALRLGPSVHGWFYRFSTLTAKAADDWTTATLGYHPQVTGLLEDMAAHYFG